MRGCGQLSRDVSTGDDRDAGGDGDHDRGPWLPRGPG